MFATPYEIARALQKDMGVDAGIKYARRIASQSTEPAFSIPYSEAANLLQAWSVPHTTNAKLEPM